MRTLVVLLGSAALSLAGVALGSCSGTSAGPACTDGIDNDGDGLIDSEDPGCDFNDGDAETPEPTACNDQIDNDNDGMIDAEDWGCQIAGSTTEAEPLVACNDGLDNDGDLLADYPQDPGCESPIDADEGNPPECNDGEDNDEDGIVDWPDEPGCTDAEDDDETDPSPAPACGDGLDNDGDGSTDYPQDPGCDAASDVSELDDCVAGLPVVGHTGGTLTGNTDGLDARLAAPDGCELTGASSIAPEAVYGFILDRTDLALLTFDTQGSALDTVLYVRVDDCAASGPLSACSDDAVGTASAVSFAAPAPGVYYAVVDGKSNFGGAYAITVTGVVAAGGQCDPADLLFTCDVGTSCQSGICTAN